VVTKRPELGAWLARRAHERRAARRERSRRALEPRPGARVARDGREWVDFSSNDYLGLARHPEVVSALARGAARWGAGSGASALVTGYGPAHRALEEALADFLGRERVLLFSSGWLANLAVAASLAGRGDTIVQDRLCHASLIDAARLSGARLVRHAHADTASLARRLDALGDERPCLVVTDGVFSMDGDLAPLGETARLAAQAGAWLVVDDAHGIGTLGPGGRGAVAAAGLGPGDVPVLVGTLGKAFGAAGAFVAGGADLVEHLVNEGRSYLFTTAPPPAVAEAARAALRIVRGEPERREALARNIAAFRRAARREGLCLGGSESAIQPVVVGASGTALAVAARLEDAGFLAVPIRPPTVPRGTARLRIALSAAHRAADIEALVDALAGALAAEGVDPRSVGGRPAGRGTPADAAEATP